ncbi:hypothetical protein PR048_015464 [Dryococelus australis]|uniref:Uncharacterized protein n=1 Tax=Dryococelus australis TaxID=614101 RepID=A0ABQ9HH12_9NEOP|nr:hypothetical protein PR048_015464 [Dryococelus australis]
MYTNHKSKQCNLFPQQNFEFNTDIAACFRKFKQTLGIGNKRPTHEDAHTTVCSPGNDEETAHAADVSLAISSVFTMPMQ